MATGQILKNALQPILQGPASLRMVCCTSFFGMLNFKVKVKISCCEGQVKVKVDLSVDNKWI